MSDHLKRLNAPDSWHIAKKTTKFITKTAPGPHNANAMPIAVWLRDHMGLARTLKEVKNKTVVHGGKVQLNMRDGANLLADNTYKSGDSIVLSLESETRFKIVDHFPFAVGNMAMVIGGRHSGKVARIVDIIKMPGSVPNKIILEDESAKTRFDTISPYIYMVGKQTPAIASWGIEQ